MNTFLQDKRFQVITATMVTALLIARLGSLLINTQNDILDINSKKTAGLQQKIKGAQALVERAPKIEADLKEAQEKLGAIESKMLPSAGDKYAAMIRLLADAVKTYKVELLNIAQPELTDTALLPDFPYKSLNFSTRFNASRQDFTKLLMSLENQYPCMQFQFQRLDQPRPEEPEKLDFELRIIGLVQPAATP